MTLIHKRVLFLCVLFAFVLTGCLGQLAGPEDSPELAMKKKYLAARKEYAQTAKKYNDHYRISPVATQQIWKEKIDPWFLQVDTALKSWKMAIDEGFDPDSQERLYLDLKAKLFVLLIDVFGVRED